MGDRDSLEVNWENDWPVVFPLLLLRTVSIKIPGVASLSLGTNFFHRVVEKGSFLRFPSSCCALYGRITVTKVSSEMHMCEVSGIDNLQLGIYKPPFFTNGILAFLN